MGEQLGNPISIAAAPVNRLIGKRYYDLSATIEVVRRLHQARVVDGFELQNLAEWDQRTPPKDEGERRFPAWRESPKYTIDEVAVRLQDTGLPVLSVHANRDVGLCLCSGETQEIDRGKSLVHEALLLAQEVGAEVCVLHLWDTWEQEFDTHFLEVTLGGIASQYPAVKAAVENIPTHLVGYTPFDLVQAFEWITLDLRWAALYDQFDAFDSIVDRIANVHLSGRLVGDRWALNPSWFPSGQESFGFYQAVDAIRNQWHYSGLLTVEISGSPSDRWENLVDAMAALYSTARAEWSVTGEQGEIS
jgi:sugar phosphate isomerase/epimerase